MLPWRVGSRWPAENKKIGYREAVTGRSHSLIKKCPSKILGKGEDRGGSNVAEIKKGGRKNTQTRQGTRRTKRIVRCLDLRQVRGWVHYRKKGGYLRSGTPTQEIKTINGSNENEERGSASRRMMACTAEAKASGEPVGFRNILSLVKGGNREVRTGVGPKNDLGSSPEEKGIT